MNVLSLAFACIVGLEMGQPELDAERIQDDGEGGESFPMVSFKDRGKDALDTVKYEPQEKAERKSVMDLISKHAEKSSLSGVAFIQNSKYWVVKSIWTVLLLASLCVMIYHLHELGKKYFEYEKLTTISLTKGNIPFPAVTLCNVNVVRKGQLGLGSTKMRKLVEKVNPDRMLNDVEQWVVVYENDTFVYDDDGEIIEEDEDTVSGTPITPSADTKQFTVTSRNSNFFDDFNTTDIDDDGDDYFDEADYMESAPKDSWEAKAEKASFDRTLNKFISYYLRENGNFSLVGSSSLGNCYTLQYDKFVSRQGGPSSGLSLMLYLESNEYIPGITNSKGVQIVVHEQQTVPFPGSEGISISAGMATSIGLRRIDIKRLGNPHGDCRGTDNFQKKYGMKYTSQACNQVCLMERIRDHCGCYDETKPIFYRRLKKKDNRKMCQRRKDLTMCMADVKWNFEIKHKTCHCYSACKETAYRQTLSSKPWPSRAFAKLMAKSVCKEKPQSTLCNIDDIDLISLRENFAKVTVYFESLDYEEYREEEGYTTFQFISDIGGTIGLYVGLSVLGAFEFVHLFVALLRHFLCPSFTPP